MFQVALNLTLFLSVYRCLVFCGVGKFCVVFALFELELLIVVCCGQLCCVCFLMVVYSVLNCFSLL